MNNNRNMAVYFIVPFIPYAKAESELTAKDEEFQYFLVEKKRIAS